MPCVAQTIWALHMPASNTHSCIYRGTFGVLRAFLIPYKSSGDIAEVHCIGMAFIVVHFIYNVLE